MALFAGALGWWLGRRSAAPVPHTSATLRRSSAQALSADSFAGDWLPVSAMTTQENFLVLTAEGDVVSGGPEADKARFVMRLSGEALVGECIEPDRRTPARMEMTPGHDRLVVTLSPADSEPDVSVCVRIDALAHASKGGGHSGEVTPDEAVAAVRALPEVAEWLRDFTGTLAERACVEVGADKGEVYTVHVYEDVPGPPGEGHNATLGWFEVNKKTGKVIKVEL
jgi:hypothetical protein